MLLLGKRNLARNLHLRKRRESRSYACLVKKEKPRPIQPKERMAAKKVRKAKSLIQVVISLWFKTTRVRTSQ